MVGLKDDSGRIVGYRTNGPVTIRRDDVFLTEANLELCIACFGYKKLVQRDTLYFPVLGHAARPVEPLYPRPQKGGER